MDRAIKQEVRRRASFLCEYCRIPQAASLITFPVDHAIARQHGGSTTLDNLALSCPHCNLHKGPNLSGVDPVSGAIVTLFNPRKNEWADHFAYQGALLVGLTPEGRATIAVLEVNDPDQVAARLVLIAEDLFPA